MAMFESLRQSRAYLSSAALNFLRGKNEGTIRGCNEALARNPSLKRAYLFRYIAYTRLGDYSSAILDTTDLISLYAPNSKLWLAVHVDRGIARCVRGNYLDAIKDAEIVMATATANKPVLALAYVLRSLARYRIGDKDDALLDIAHAEEIATTQPRFSVRILSAIYSNKAALYGEQGDYANALTAIDKSIEMGQRRKAHERSALFSARAFIQSSTGDSTGAYADLVSAERLAGTNPMALAVYHDIRGDIDAARGDYTRAIESYNEAQRLSPQLASVYQDRSKAYQALGNTEAADRDLEQIKRLAIDPPTPIPPRPQAQPTKPNKLSPRTFAIIGLILLEVITIAGLLNFISHINYSCGCVNSAITLYQKGDYAGASSLFSTAIADDPQEAILYKDRGLAEEQLGDFDNAIADFKKALALNPRDKDASYMRDFIDEYQ